MRHNPPFFERPWVITEEGRGSRIGTAVECLKCNRAEWPEGLIFKQRTPEFDETSLPAGLRKDHTTKNGTWAKIYVVEGALRFRSDLPACGETILTPSNPGIVVPCVAHSVEPQGSVRFFVEFYQSPWTGSASAQ